jgi:hypothetical protein
VVGGGGEEVGEVVVDRESFEQPAGLVEVAVRVAVSVSMASSSAAAMRCTTSRSTRVPPSSTTSLCSHCQTWERAISAVAASSIRLKIVTAPVPPSQAPT